MGFPDVSAVKSGNTVTNPPGAVFGPRQMRDYEFVWMVRGNATYRWADEVVAAPEGSVVLCRPGAVDAFDWDPDQPSTHAYCHFDVRRVPRGWPRPTDWPLVRELPEGDVFRPLMRHLLTWSAPGTSPGSAAAQDDGGVLALRLLLRVFVLNQVATEPPLTPTLPPPVARVVQWVQDTLETWPDRPITLDDLARAGSVSPAHLCRLFTQHLGHGPMQSLRLARLDKAAAMLARSSEPVNRIAAATGFASPYHFSRRFHEAFGLSPTAYRRRVFAAQPVPPFRASRRRR